MVQANLDKYIPARKFLKRDEHGNYSVDDVINELMDIIKNSYQAQMIENETGVGQIILIPSSGKSSINFYSSSETIIMNVSHLDDRESMKKELLESLPHMEEFFSKIPAGDTLFFSPGIVSKEYPLHKPQRKLNTEAFERNKITITTPTPKP